MIKISKLADYAVMILATMVQSDEELMTASSLSLKTRLPEPTVAKILKILARGNILVSVRGANGGYRMNGKPGEISVAKIVSAVDGPISLTACVDGASECGYEKRCPVKGRWDGVNYAIREAMESISLTDMLGGEAAMMKRGRELHEHL